MIGSFSNDFSLVIDSQPDGTLPQAKYASDVLAAFGMIATGTATAGSATTITLDLT